MNNSTLNMNSQPSTINCQPSTIFIIPCYNEEKHIESIIFEVKKELPEAKIVVVNESSADRSAEIAKSTNSAEVISLPVNLGIGGTVQTGIKYANNNSYQYLVRIDGDGQHPVRFIKDVLKPVIDGEADMVIGSRFVNPMSSGSDARQSGFKSTPARRVGIHLFRILNKIIINQAITDSTSGFRAYNRRTIEYLAEHYPAFDYPEPEEITLLGLNGFKIVEVPVQMEDRKFGLSSITWLKAVYYMIKVVFAILMVALRSKI